MELLEVKIENVDKEIADLVEQRKQIDGGMDMNIFTYYVYLPAIYILSYKVKLSGETT